MSSVEVFQIYKPIFNNFSILNDHVSKSVNRFNQCFCKLSNSNLQIFESIFMSFLLRCTFHLSIVIWCEWVDRSVALMSVPGHRCSVPELLLIVLCVSHFARSIVLLLRVVVRMIARLVVAASVIAGSAYRHLGVTTVAGWMVAKALTSLLVLTRIIFMTNLCMIIVSKGCCRITCHAVVTVFFVVKFWQARRLINWSRRFRAICRSAAVKAIGFHLRSILRRLAHSIVQWHVIVRDLVKSDSW